MAVAREAQKKPALAELATAYKRVRELHPGLPDWSDLRDWDRYTHAVQSMDPQVIQTWEGWLLGLRWLSGASPSWRGLDPHTTAVPPELVIKKARGLANPVPPGAPQGGLTTARQVMRRLRAIDRSRRKTILVSRIALTAAIGVLLYGFISLYGLLTSAVGGLPLLNTTELAYPCLRHPHHRGGRGRSSHREHGPREQRSRDRDRSRAQLCHRVGRDHRPERTSLAAANQAANRAGRRHRDAQPHDAESEPDWDRDPSPAPQHGQARRAYSRILPGRWALGPGVPPLYRRPTPAGVASRGRAASWSRPGRRGWVPHWTTSTCISGGPTVRCWEPLPSRYPGPASTCWVLAPPRWRSLVHNAVPARTTVAFPVRVPRTYRARRGDRHRDSRADPGRTPASYPQWQVPRE